MHTDLPCLHADASLLVFDKPAGLPSVPGRPAELHDCVASRARACWPDALTVHRLDMATSGLIVMARGAAAQRALSIAFASREVAKRYVAVVHGRLAGGDADGWSLIELPLAADWPHRPRQRVDRVHGKPSATRWRVLAHGAATTRVELEPLTGRSHQLRVHLQALGHPIVGDTLYGAGDEAAPRLLLHASALAFAHPATGVPLAFDSAPPF